MPPNNALERTPPSGETVSRALGGQTDKLDTVHKLVYSGILKKRDLQNAPLRVGWKFLRHGKRHDIWTDGEREEPINHHNEINEKLARVILRQAKRRY
jgi:mRNA interferase HicA